MGNHEYWDTPEYRAEEALLKADEKRRRAKYDRLVKMPADAFTVEQINDLRTFQSSPVFEILYDQMLAQTYFRRVDQAKHACYWRLHPQPWTDTSKGARILYDAVCRLWQEAISAKA